MTWEKIADPHAIRRFCLRDPIRYIFYLGDLDASEWPYCRWYALPGRNGPREILLDYRGLSVPCFQMIGSGGPLGPSLQDALGLFPPRCYLFLDRHDVPRVSSGRMVRHLGSFLRMSWDRLPEWEPDPCQAAVRRLGEEDLGELADLLERSYPGSYFEPLQLRKGVYFGVGEPGSLAACSGLHAYSESERVAVIGNVATLPSLRSRGYARAATAALLREIAPRVDWIGLNVETQNAAAQRVYRRLGFRDCLEYEALYLDDIASDS